MVPPVDTTGLRAILLSTLTLLLLVYSSTAIPSHRTPQELVRLSCIHARYPSLCLHTLSSYSGPANPRSIAQAAVRASLSCARSTSGFLRTRVPGRAHLSKHERAAVNDCVEQVSALQGQLRFDYVPAYAIRIALPLLSRLDSSLC